MPYVFIPRLPTKAAWDARPFSDYKIFDDMMTALRRYPMQIRGDILFKPDEVTFVPFNNWRDLANQLKKIDHATVSRIHLYDIGYFWFRDDQT